MARGSNPGMMRPPMGSGPPGAYGAPQAAGSGPGAPPPRGSHPGMQAPPPPPPPADFGIDDDDSEDQATVMMDASSGDVQAAIEAALASAPDAPTWDEEDEGGQRTIGLAEAGLDFSDVPDPTGGTDSVRPLPAAGAPGPAAGRPGPAAGLPPARQQLSSKPTLPEDLQATAAFPEDMIASLDLGDLSGGASDESLEAPPGGALGDPTDLAAAPLGGMPAEIGGGVPAGPVSAPRQVEMFVPEVEETGGGGLKIALIIATVVLVLVVVGVVLLYLDRQGTLELGI